MVSLVAFEGVEVYSDGSRRFFNDSNGNAYAVVGVSNNVVVGMPVSTEVSDRPHFIRKQRKEIRANIEYVYSFQAFNERVRFAGVPIDTKEVIRRNSGELAVRRHNTNVGATYSESRE